MERPAQVTNDQQTSRRDGSCRASNERTITVNTIPLKITGWTIARSPRCNAVAWSANAPALKAAPRIQLGRVANTVSILSFDDAGAAPAARCCNALPVANRADDANARSAADSTLPTSHGFDQSCNGSGWRLGAGSRGPTGHRVS